MSTLGRSRWVDEKVLRDVGLRADKDEGVTRNMNLIVMWEMRNRGK